MRQWLTRASLVLALAAAPAASHAEWRRDDSMLTWRSQDDVLWTFSFDAQKGKPFFHPLSPGGGASLTNFRPEDHPWHYGLWFSWKYINGVNYWEEDRGTGRAQGATQWDPPEIDARADGGASIRMQLRYRHPDGRIDLHEERTLEISPPDEHGYSIDWRMRFRAGKQGAVLDRTPMPGEPGGKVNGGYAGLSARIASAPVEVTMLSSDVTIDEFASDRARPQAPAVAANFVDGGRQLGGLAILSDPANAGERAPWYLINAPEGMRFMCAAVLAPQVRKLAPGEEWTLNYRIVVQRIAWTPATLRAATQSWPARAMSSAVFDWEAIPAKPTDVRLLRQFFQSPTATLDELEVHATTLAPGESSHPPHRHPNEELVIVKEGVLEAYSNGARQRIGPGSVIFNASNELHAVTNVGDAPATYHVINWQARGQKSGRRPSR